MILDIIFDALDKVLVMAKILWVKTCKFLVCPFSLSSTDAEKLAYIYG